MSDAFRVMKIAHQFCLKLLKNGAIIPQLLKSKVDEYFVRWLPAMNNSDIKSIVLTLSQAIPPDLIQLQDKKKAIAADIIKEENGFMKKLTKDDIEFLFS